MAYKQPDKNGFYGRFGDDLSLKPDDSSFRIRRSLQRKSSRSFFSSRIDQLLKQYVGRETPLYYAKNFYQVYRWEPRSFLKEKTLNHTGAHKINNALGQVLLAHRMGKRRSSQKQGPDSTVLQRQRLLLYLIWNAPSTWGRRCQTPSPQCLSDGVVGAKVQSVTDGSCVLKMPVNALLRAWVANVEDTHYIMGSALGPHPFPEIVRDFQSVIGREAKRQFAEQNDGALPNAVLACVGGGSNAIGLFYPLLRIPLLPCMWGRSCWPWSGYRPTCSNLDQGASGESSRSLDGCVTGCPWTDFSSLLDFSRSRLSRNWARAFLFPWHQAGDLCACDRPEALEAFQLLSKVEGSHSSPGIEPCYCL